MNNNQSIVITAVVILLLVLGVAGIWYVMNSPSPSVSYAPETANDTNQNNTQNTAEQAKGNLYFSITDAAANMNNVTAIIMTIDKVEAYSNTNGWMTISQTPQSFSLLDLKAKNETALAAKALVLADTY